MQDSKIIYEILNIRIPNLAEKKISYLSAVENSESTLVYKIMIYILNIFF